MSTLVRLSQPDAYQQPPQNISLDVAGIPGYGKIQWVAAEHSIDCIISSDARTPISAKVKNLTLPERLQEVSLPVLSIQSEKSLGDIEDKNIREPLSNYVNNISNFKSGLTGYVKIIHYVQAILIPLEAKEEATIRFYSNHNPSLENPILAIISSPGDVHNLLLERPAQEIVGLQDDRINQGTLILNERLKPEEIDRSMIQLIAISTKRFPSARYSHKTIAAASRGQDVCDGYSGGRGTGIGQFHQGAKVAHLETCHEHLTLDDRPINVISLIPIAYDDPDDLIHSLPRIKSVMQRILAEQPIQPKIKRQKITF